MSSTIALRTSRSIVVTQSRLFSSSATSFSKNAKKTPSDKPDRPPNSFAMFLKDNFKQVHEANPSAKLADISKKVSDMWHSLDNSVKQEYKDKFQAAQKFYRENLPPVAPKRAPSAYTLYQKDQFKALAERKPLTKSDFAEVARSIADSWKSLSHDARSKYESLAAKAKEEYLADYPERVKKSKRAATAYGLFFREKAQELKHLDFQQTSKSVADQWKLLNESAKQRYKDLALEEKKAKGL